MLSFFDKLKFDWWEITNLGWIGYFRYVRDWVKYLFGFSAYRPDIFAYSEIHQDMDFLDVDDE